MTAQVTVDGVAHEVDVDIEAMDQMGQTLACWLMGPTDWALLEQGEATSDAVQVLVYVVLKQDFPDLRIRDIDLTE